jgi:RHS repeat-associated protein
VTTTGSQNTTDTYLYRRDGTPLELIRTIGGSTSRYWYEVDGRSNVIALTDSSGTTVDRYAYDLWGKLISSSESVPQRLRSAGAWYDSELGWYWMSTRAYDPGLERFLQPDRSQQEGIFTYAYAGDDPVDYDTSGMLASPSMNVCRDDYCAAPSSSPARRQPRRQRRARHLRAQHPRSRPPCRWSARGRGCWAPASGCCRFLGRLPHLCTRHPPRRAQPGQCLPPHRGSSEPRPRTPGPCPSEN